MHSLVRRSIRRCGCRRGHLDRVRGRRVRCRPDSRSDPRQRSPAADRRRCRDAVVAGDRAAGRGDRGHRGRRAEPGTVPVIVFDRERRRARVDRRVRRTDAGPAAGCVRQRRRRTEPRSSPGSRETASARRSWSSPYGRRRARGTVLVGRSLRVVEERETDRVDRRLRVARGAARRSVRHRARCVRVGQGRRRDRGVIHHPLVAVDLLLERAATPFGPRALRLLVVGSIAEPDDADRTQVRRDAEPIEQLAFAVHDAEVPTRPGLRRRRPTASASTTSPRRCPRRRTGQCVSSSMPNADLVRLRVALDVSRLVREREDERRRDRPRSRRPPTGTRGRA